MKLLLPSALTVLVALTAVACGSGRDADKPTATETEMIAPTRAECATPKPGERPTGCLSICVDLSPSASSTVSIARAAQSVIAGLPEYAKLYDLASAAQATAGAGAFPALVTPRITAGCPEGFLPPPNGTDLGVKSAPVTTRSPFHVHLFITGDQELAGRLPPGEYSVRYVYERECSAPRCAEVTTAVFMGAADLQNPSLVGWALADGTGITPILRYPCGHPDPSPKCQGIRP